MGHGAAGAAKLRQRRVQLSARPEQVDHIRCQLVRARPAGGSRYVGYAHRPVTFAESRCNPVVRRGIRRYESSALSTQTTSGVFNTLERSGVHHLGRSERSKRRAEPAREPDRAEPGEAEIVGYLLGIRGPFENQIFAVGQGTQIIGRCKRASIRVKDDARTSREHVLLSPREDGDIEVFDLHTSNGTYVNGHRIRKARIRAGDKLSIGQSVFEYSNAEPEPLPMTDNSGERRRRATMQARGEFVV